MQGVPIKFRAKGLDNNVYFGNIRKCYAISGKNCEGFSSNGFIEVFEDSICQLCGYDIDGNEVYEGDILIDSDNREHKVFLNPAANAQDMRTHTIDKTFVEVFQLKKKGEE